MVQKGTETSTFNVVRESNSSRGSLPKTSRLRAQDMLHSPESRCRVSSLGSLPCAEFPRGVSLYSGRVSRCNLWSTGVLVLVCLQWCLDVRALPQVSCIPLQFGNGNSCRHFGTCIRVRSGDNHVPWMTFPPRHLMRFVLLPPDSNCRLDFSASD